LTITENQLASPSDCRFEFIVPEPGDLPYCVDSPFLTPGGSCAVRVFVARSSCPQDGSYMATYTVVGCANAACAQRATATTRVRVRAVTP
jgi:hypothetical protein